MCICCPLPMCRAWRRSRVRAGSAAGCMLIPPVPPVRPHRRTPAQLRQRYPHGLGWHARERPAGRSRQGRAQLHRYAQSVAQGRHADGGRHPRGSHRRAEPVHRGPAVPGSDEGPAKQPGDVVSGGFGRAPGAGALAEPQPDTGRGQRGAHHPVRAGARGESCGGIGGHAQDGHRGPAQPAWQAQ